MKKHTKMIMLFAIVSALIMPSCSVQQFAVNTSVQPFANGGTVFGEKTKGQTIKKGREIFVLGINLSNCDTKNMATLISADKYTIETKRNLASSLINLVSFGLVDHKVVKVIKRDK